MFSKNFPGAKSFAKIEAYDLGREFEKLEHDSRLCPPVYVKPFVKHQQNDAVDK